jgi:hypothetical protein
MFAVESIAWSKACNKAASYVLEQIESFDWSQTANVLACIATDCIAAEQRLSDFEISVSQVAGAFKTEISELSTKIASEGAGCPTFATDVARLRTLDSALWSYLVTSYEVASSMASAIVPSM